jgi:hypothetical protein
MYKDGDSIESRRFKQFNDCFENYKSSGQSGNESNYNIDLCMDPYILDDFRNNPDIGWITFKI